MPALLFDFFGTLVAYQPDRARLGYPQTHHMASSFGIRCDHDTFVDTWDESSQSLEQASRRTLREFSMTDAATAFADASDVQLADRQLSELGASFVEEWSQHVHPIPGVAAMIERLARTWSISIVSNTHDVDMVPTMLDRMGISQIVSAVTLSVEHGWLKPHASIYQVALDAVASTSDGAVFIGDSYEADYVGPIQAGMRAFLIDPDHTHDVPDHHRISSILELELALSTLDS